MLTSRSKIVLGNDSLRLSVAVTALKVKAAKVHIEKGLADPPKTKPILVPKRTLKRLAGL